MEHATATPEVARTGTPTWKQPTIREIAAVAGVGPATVDRVLNDRSHVSEGARTKVRDALDKLNSERRIGGNRLDIRLYCVSGESFNAEIAAAERVVNRTFPGVDVQSSYVATNELSVESLGEEIVEGGADSDGVILIANEHPIFNRAVRRLQEQGIPVICLTTDLPNSARHAYVGNDQVAAGSTAAHLIGKGLPAEPARILTVISVPFRSQQEREMGFRRVLRTDFPHLEIHERVASDDVPDHTFRLMAGYLESNDPPAAIYNVAGGNRGIAQALRKFGLEERVMFIGHELTAHSRKLLEQGIMDYVLSHDYVNEMRTAVRCIRSLRNGAPLGETESFLLIHTRYNCGL